MRLVNNNNVLSWKHLFVSIGVTVDNIVNHITRKIRIAMLHALGVIETN